MTSKFSIDNRELLQRISSGEAVVGIDFGNLIVRELAAFRLAAMDSEPVAVTGNGLNVALSLTQMQIDWICNTCASIYNTRNDDVAQGYINEIRATLERLAAMDSESGCLPLDYLQGHKDGLEWASQLAEANHPDTGDWLYDDPIELAKAIRKGPDMPPAQPVADSEPDRNPVLAYADSYRDMAKQGVESVPIWSVITDIERNIAPLYRHAQPAVDSEFIPKNLDKALGVLGMAIPESREEFNFQTERWIQRLIDRVIRYADEFQEQPASVVPQDVLEALQKLARIRLELNDFDGDRRGIADCLGDAEEALIEVVNRRAAMLQAGTLINEGTKQAWTGIPDIDNAINMLDRIDTLESCDDDRIEAVKTVLRGLAGNSPVIPEGYMMVPKEPTKEMIDAGWLHFMGTKNPSSKGTYKAMLAAAPHDTPALNSVQSVVTASGKWIPVSERMPEVGVKVLCFPVKDEPIHATFNGQLWLQDISWSGSDEPIDNVIPTSVTHWMPLPAAPQEVSDA